MNEITTSCFFPDFNCFSSFSYFSSSPSSSSSPTSHSSSCSQFFNRHKMPVLSSTQHQFKFSNQLFLGRPIALLPFSDRSLTTVMVVSCIILYMCSIHSFFLFLVLRFVSSILHIILDSVFRVLVLSVLGDIF